MSASARETTARIACWLMLLVQSSDDDLVDDVLEVDESDPESFFGELDKDSAPESAFSAGLVGLRPVTSAAAFFL